MAEETERMVTMNGPVSCVRMNVLPIWTFFPSSLLFLEDSGEEAARGALLLPPCLGKCGAPGMGSTAGNGTLVIL